MRFRPFTALFGLALSAGCSDKSSTAVPLEQTTFAPTLGVDLARSLKLRPGLYYRDITPGSGAVLTAGQTVAMRYTGSFVNGAVFDSNSAPQPPFVFRLGSGQVIKGWDEGLAGMKVGGRRQLVISPELAYGPNDYGPIPGNSVLVFTVDALSAQ
jgi:peptidylprolyl isomerase